MGKQLPLQRRGRGTNSYRVPSHNFLAPINLYPIEKQGQACTVEDIVDDPGHTTPLAVIKFQDGSRHHLPAAEGLRVGQQLGTSAEKGAVLPLSQIPEGSTIFCIELSRGDLGKLVRAAGNYARLVSKEGNKVVLRLPSGQFKTITDDCRAIVGVCAGGGRLEKPWVTAGKKFHAMKVKNRLWPKVKGNVKNPVDHPFGGGSHKRVGKPMTVSRNAPPGRKVGYIAARRTGRRR